jgi:hypothetical protein
MADKLRDETAEAIQQAEVRTFFEGRQTSAVVDARSLHYGRRVTSQDVSRRYADSGKVSVCFAVVRPKRAPGQF